MVVVRRLGGSDWSGAAVLIDGEEIVSTMDNMGWTDIDVGFVEALVTRLAARLGFDVELVGRASE
jgi:hypothetical protein